MKRWKGRIVKAILLLSFLTIIHQWCYDVGRLRGIMMQQHSLFFDIDGTILGTMSKQVEPTHYFKEAIKKLQSQGHLCFICSGRPYSHLSKEIKAVNFDGYILCNGALVIKDNEVLVSHFFPKEEIKNIQLLLERHHAPYMVVSTKESFVPMKFKEAYSMFEQLGIPLGTFVQEVNVEEMDVVKIETGSVSEQAAIAIRELRSQGYEIDEYEGYNIFDLCMPNVTKGKSILDILKKLNIPVENSIAFGDGTNDLDMLECVGYGVAMGNASPKVKEVADAITENCKDEGIVRELQRKGFVKNIID